MTSTSASRLKNAGHAVSQSAPTYAPLARLLQRQARLGVSAWIWLFRRSRARGVRGGRRTARRCPRPWWRSWDRSRAEAAHLMGAQTVRPPDPLHRADAEPPGRGQRRRRPVGTPSGGGSASVHVTTRSMTALGNGGPCRPRLVAQQAVHAVGHDRSCQRPRTVRHAGPAHPRSAAALRARQNDPGPPHVLRAVRAATRREPRPIGRGHVDLTAHDASTTGRKGRELAYHWRSHAAERLLWSGAPSASHALRGEPATGPFIPCGATPGGE